MAPVQVAPPIDPEVMALILKLPEDRQEKTLQMVLRAQTRMTSDPATELLRDLVEGMRSAPASQVQQIDVNKLVDDVLERREKMEERMAERYEARYGSPPGGMDSPLAQVAPGVAPKSWVEELGLTDAIKKMVMDKILGKDSAGEMGFGSDMIYDKDTGTYIPKKVKNYEEYEKVSDRLDRKRAVKDDLDGKKATRKMIEENIIKPVSKRLPGLLQKAEEGVENLGKPARGGNLRAARGAAAPVPQLVQEYLPCGNCGFHIPIPDPPPGKLKCPKCGEVHLDAEEQAKEAAAIAAEQGGAPPVLHAPPVAVPAGSQDASGVSFRQPR